MSLFNLSGRRLAPGFLVFVSVLLVACGGGGDSGSDDDGTGGGGGGGTGGTNEKPAAQIVFPPMDALSTGQTLVVRGTASDDGAVDGVTVNGVTAVSSDGFATWTATVPLTMGANEIVVAVEDDEGETTSNAASVDVTRVEQPMVALTGIKIDAANNRAVVLDSTQRTIFSVDLATGVQMPLSSPTVGSGVHFTAALNLDIDSSGTTAWLFDYLSSTLFEVSLATGQRRVLSSPAVGSGPLPETVRDIAVDTVAGKSYVNDYDYIYEIDHATGDRAIVLDYDASALPPYTYIFGLEWDAMNDRLVAVALWNADIYLIDPASGGVTTIALSDASIQPYDVAIDSTGTRAWILDTTYEGVYEVALANGSAVEIASDSTGTGASIGDGNSLAVLESEDMVLVANLEGEVIGIAADLSRTRVSAADDVRIGSGPELAGSNAVVFDLTAGSVYISESFDRRFASVDLGTGERSVVENVDGVERMAFDPTADRLLGMTGNAVYEINPATGVRRALGVVDEVTQTTSIFALEVDSEENRILFATSNQIFEASLDDLTGAAVSLYPPPPGGEIGLVNDIALDRTRSRVLATGAADYAIRAVDTNTAAVTELMSGAEADALGIDQLSHMQIDAAGDNAFVMDARGSTLYRMNLDTVALESLAGFAAGSSAGFGFVNGMQVDEQSGLAWVLAVDAIVVLDTVGGDHVIVSR